MSIILHRPTNREAASCTINDGNPQLFLAGPILGARNWQKFSVGMLSELLPKNVDFHVSDPRWDTLPSDQRIGKDGQRTWEKRHYRAALNAGRWGTRGVMMFFLPAQSAEAPTPNPPGRSYAQGTRSEFSEAVGAHLFSGTEVPIVLGMSSMFARREHGLHEYRHTAEELGLEIRVGLVSTVHAAAQLVLASRTAAPTTV